MKNKLENFVELSLETKLKNKISEYIRTIWSDKVTHQIFNDWIENFNNADHLVKSKERLNMLYLLSKFSYFGKKEIRIMLQSLFRDLYKYPIIHKIRKNNNDTTDIDLINKKFKEELDITLFISVGGGSESGAHLLMPFRHGHENTIKEEQCKTQNEAYFITEQFDYKNIIIKNTKYKKYIFIDDFIGTGEQVMKKLAEDIELLREKDPSLEINYYVLIATEDGLSNVRDKKIFDNVNTLYELDLSFKSVENTSRYFQEKNQNIEIEFTKEKVTQYGSSLYKNSLGHENCQLLLGFEHNTPDNSLPIFWSEKNNWKPIFKRYIKI